MLSLQLIREQPEVVRKALSARHTEAPLDEVLELDVRRRDVMSETERLRAEQNAASKQIGAAKDKDERQRMIDAVKGVSMKLDELTPRLRDAEERLQSLVMEIPNLPDASVPYGESEDDNAVGEQSGEASRAEWQKPHWELGEALGIIDFDRGVKLSGSRFYVLEGAGARLQRALIAFMLELHIDRHGYKEMYLPAMVKEETMWRSGQLPKFRDNLYHDAEEDFWFVPTAEVPLTNLHADEILEPEQVPLHYVAYTPCFRREKMSAGRDVRGIKRGHQFDKVEMYKFCAPEDSPAELESMLDDAKDVCRALGLTYRVVEICTADLGFNAAKTYDLEAWAPGVGEWLEISSVSNCTDFQARRANIRFRREPGGRPELVHTLNGSGLALPRTMIAVMETYQRPDGTIEVPEVLLPWMGGVGVIRGADDGRLE
ncbi:MAG TPA: serine--tRNA ligase [Dehalococcoidia bacterium]|nr:serine--tRNA ligase [Dehalococcoidia bacterium]